MSIESCPLGNELKSALGLTDGLRGAEQENAPFAQGKMKQRDGLRLRLGVQIDQQIAARNHIHARKWWVCEHILDRKYHEGAQARRDPVSNFIFDEISRQPIRGNCCDNIQRI